MIASRIKTSLRKILFLLALLLITLNSWAQDEHFIDSLKGEIEGHALDTGMVDLYTSAAKYYKEIHPDSSVIFYNKALELSMDIGDLKKEAETRSLLSTLNLTFGRYEKSLELSQQALSIYQTLGDPLMIAQCHNTIGLCLRELPDPRPAIKAYEASYKVLIENGFEKESIRPKHNMAVIHYSLGQFDEARSIYLENLERLKRFAWDGALAPTYNNLGRLEQDEGNIEKALEYYHLALGKEYLIGDYYGRSNTLTNIGEVFIIQDKLNEALDTLKKGLRIAEEIDAAALITKNLKQTSRVYEKLGDSETALRMFKAYFVRYDSLSQEQESDQIIGMQKIFELEQEEAKIRLAKQEKRSVIRFAIVSGICLLGVLAFVIFYLFRQRKFNRMLERKNSTIETQNIELREVNSRLFELSEEKDILMGIVAHDLKAPLSKAKGLIQLIEMSGELNEDQLLYIEKMEQVFQGGRTLIEELVLLSNLESGKTISMTKCDLADLVKTTADSFRQTAKEKSIQLNCQIEFDSIPFKTNPDYFNRVLDNLISNALKFSQARTKVELIVESKGRVNRITIRDQGPGISESEQKKLFKKFGKLSNRPTGGESSTGLGLFIVKELVEKLDGKIIVRSEVGKGTEFILEFVRG